MVNSAAMQMVVILFLAQSKQSRDREGAELLLFKRGSLQEASVFIILKAPLPNGRGSVSWHRPNRAAIMRERSFFAFKRGSETDRAHKSAIAALFIPPNFYATLLRKLGTYSKEKDDDSNERT